MKKIQAIAVLQRNGYDGQETAEFLSKQDTYAVLNNGSIMLYDPTLSREVGGYYIKSKPKPILKPIHPMSNLLNRAKDLNVWCRA